MTQEVSKQLTLPFEVISENLDPQYAAIVKQNWQITFSRQKLGSVYSKRVMALIASQIKEDGSVQEYYQITADRIIKDTSISSRSDVYKIMKDVVYEMSEVCFYLEDEGTGRIVPRHLLDTTRFENPAGYYNGKLTVAFNPQLKGIVQNLAHFSKYELERFMQFGSWYTMRLYELLEAFRDQPYVEWGIENYRDMMGCGAVRNSKGERVTNTRTGKLKYEKYTSHSDMITKTTKEPLRELKGTDLEFIVTPIYSDHGRGRRPIVKVRFDFIKPPKTPADKIAEWSKHEVFYNAYRRLKALGVSDTVIAKYIPIIGMDETNKLLYAWKLRMQPDSKEKIANPAHYCTKVIKDMADKLQAGQRNPSSKT